MQIESYQVMLLQNVKDFINDRVFKPAGVCDIDDHKTRLIRMYSEIIDAIHLSSEHLISVKKRGLKGYLAGTLL